MSSIAVIRLGSCGAIAAVLSACSGDASQPTPSGAMGGSTAAAGGVATGGMTTGPGGSTSTPKGGTQGVGGSSTLGGSSMQLSGGQSNASGGAATGGNATGGLTSNGGNATGGKATGGLASTGGAGIGGVSTGGKATGGTATGGVSTGGKATGGAATGGAAAGGSTTGGGSVGGQCSTGSSAFTLSWQDDFDTLNSATWSLMDFTFAGNLATFTPNNASVANGILTMRLTANSASTTSPYWGVEMRSAQTVTYGRVSSRMRFAPGSGVVSGLVLFYTPYPNCNWNEIDIEHLGNSSNSSQLNAMVYAGTPAANCTTSVTPTQDPLIANLGFNAETEFHQYDIEWTPTSVKFYADCVLLRTWTANIARLTLPQNILYTIWASSAAAWAGAVNASTAPTSADVDWIKVYRWNG